MSTNPAAPPAFHLLAKPTGAICNLDCAYCFYLPKEKLYPGSRFRMTDEMLETYIRRLIEAHRFPEVTIAWQGGEPMLMGLDFFRRSIEIQQNYRRPDMTILNTIQTNGTLINDEWVAFFREHNFLVGISIDGPRERHDVFRRDKKGLPTFDRVIQGLDCLKEHGVEVNALVTIHKANADNPLDVYRFLRDELGIKYIQLIPIVERRNEMDAVSDFSVTAGQYGRFLITIFEEWVRSDVGEIFVNMFDVALANWSGEPVSLCVFSPTCGMTLAMEHNGDMYACDHFVSPDHFLGNISEVPMIEMVASPKQLKFGRDKLDLLPRFCRKCKVRFACHGGCPKDRFIKTPDGEAGLNFLCAGYKAFFKHIDRSMRIMTGLLRENRAPAEIMQMVANEQGQTKTSLGNVGRNDPCPCGSGKKYKQCHGR
ncbi:MAG: anaerobic sulfatase maturase [Deltaproteobacteria bacterium RBG_13_43_22]|nr:MAG: anaerobic sulfatase maturase [Deltaproteobacteria bacterium RBG_13_43_22]